VGSAAARHAPGHGWIPPRPGGLHRARRDVAGGGTGRRRGLARPGEDRGPGGVSRARALHRSGPAGSRRLGERGPRAARMLADIRLGALLLIPDTPPRRRRQPRESCRNRSACGHLQAGVARHVRRGKADLSRIRKPRARKRIGAVDVRSEAAVIDLFSGKRTTEIWLDRQGLWFVAWQRSRQDSI